MAIYFLRHGQSVANVQHIFAGQRNDSPLTDLGIEQAKISGVKIKKLNINRIITSNLERAIQTGNEVAKVIGLDANKIEVDKRLAEYDMGVLTNTPVRDISSEDFIGADGAENVIDFYNRVIFALKRYKSCDENILLVSHAGVNKIIEASKIGMDLKDFHTLIDCPNASVFELDLNWLK